MRNQFAAILAIILFLLSLTSTGYGAGVTIVLDDDFYVISIPPEPEITLGSLVVEADSPPPEGLFVGQVLQYRATAILSDNSRIDVTELVYWYATNPFIVSISNWPSTKGQATGLSEGQTSIFAVDQSSGVSSSPVALVIQEEKVVACNTVAEIISNSSCLGRAVTLQGYLTERLDSDNYTFYDGTGSVKIEYEDDIPLYVSIEIIGRVDGSEIEVSSYRVL